MNTTKEDRLRKKRPKMEYWIVVDGSGTRYGLFDEKEAAEHCVKESNKHREIGHYKIIRLKEVK